MNSRNSYAVYLLSEHWQDFRIAVHLDRNGKCERCGRKSGLQVHHRHYRTLWREKLTDVELLCGWCHQKEHDKEFPAPVVDEVADAAARILRRRLQTRLEDLTKAVQKCVRQGKLKKAEKFMRAVERTRKELEAVKKV